jgi:hypothetical protein
MPEQEQNASRQTTPYGVWNHDTPISNPLARFNSRDETLDYIKEQLELDPDARLYYGKLYGPLWVEQTVTTSIRGLR